MSVRTFKLVNELGQEYSLMDINNYCLLTDITGLGYSYSTTYEQLSHNFLVNSRKIDQNTIGGNLNTINYDNFNSFINFVESAEDLQFVYGVPFDSATKTYYRDIKLKSLGKTEKKTNGILTETVEFECLSLWYEENETIFTIEAVEGERRYEFEWDSRYIDYNTRSITYNNTGHIEAPFQVEIEGFAQNPSIVILVDDEVYASITIPITIEEYEKLLYSSKPGDIYIYKENTDGTKESLWLQEYIDINQQNIFKLPLGASTIQLIADDDIVNAKITIFPQYKAV